MKFQNLVEKFKSKITKKVLIITASALGGVCILSMSVYIAYLSGQNNALKTAQLNASTADSSIVSSVPSSSSDAESAISSPSSVPTSSSKPSARSTPVSTAAVQTAPTPQVTTPTPTPAPPPAQPETPATPPQPDNSARIQAINGEIASLQAQIDSANATYNAKVPPLQAIVNEESARAPGLLDAKIAAMHDRDYHPESESYQHAYNIAAGNYTACLNRKIDAENQIAQAQAELNAVLDPANARLAELQRELATLQ